MSPRSRSRSMSGRRSYTKSPERRNGHRKSFNRHYYDSRSHSDSRHPPSPPPLPPVRHNGRYSADSRSTSRSITPRQDIRRRQVSRSRSRSRSRSSFDKRRNTREKPLPCRCIGVFGLSVYTTQQKIREIFSKYGPIERIQVVIDAQTGRSRGFCFIYYENLADAKAARDNCCGMEIDDRRIRVAYSITERPHTPTPGVYMGRATKSYREREYHDRYRDEYRSRRRSPSPYTSSRNGYYRSEHRRRYERSRSRSYSPRRSRY